MESLNDLQISCKKCNVAFKLGDHVVMTKNTDFFHLLCFKSKGKFYRFFNKAATFITWVDSKVMMAEYVKAMNDLMSKNADQTSDKHEQLQSLQLSMIHKTEYAVVDVEDEKVHTLAVTMQAERDENDLTTNKSSAKLTENLEQLMSDVDDLKTQISYFSDEKTRDETRIKDLQQQNQSLKRQICELRWQSTHQDSEVKTKSVKVTAC